MTFLTIFPYSPNGALLAEKAVQPEARFPIFVTPLWKQIVDVDVPKDVVMKGWIGWPLLADRTPAESSDASGGSIFGKLKQGPLIQLPLDSRLSQHARRRI